MFSSTPTVIKKKSVKLLNSLSNTKLVNILIKSGGFDPKASVEQVVNGFTPWAWVIRELGAEANGVDHQIDKKHPSFRQAVDVLVKEGGVDICQIVHVENLSEEEDDDSTHNALHYLLINGGKDTTEKVDCLLKHCQKDNIDILHAVTFIRLPYDAEMIGSVSPLELILTYFHPDSGSDLISNMTSVLPVFIKHIKEISHSIHDSELMSRIVNCQTKQIHPNRHMLEVTTPFYTFAADALILGNQVIRVLPIDDFLSLGVNLNIANGVGIRTLLEYAMDPDFNNDGEEDLYKVVFLQCLKSRTNTNRNMILNFCCEHDPEFSYMERGDTLLDAAIKYKKKHKEDNLGVKKDKNLIQYVADLSNETIEILLQRIKEQAFVLQFEYGDHPAFPKMLNNFIDSHSLTTIPQPQELTQIFTDIMIYRGIKQSFTEEKVSMPASCNFLINNYLTELDFQFFPTTGAKWDTIGPQFMRQRKIEMGEGKKKYTPSAPTFGRAASFNPPNPPPFQLPPSVHSTLSARESTLDTIVAKMRQLEIQSSTSAREPIVSSSLSEEKTISTPLPRRSRKPRPIPINLETTSCSETEQKEKGLLSLKQAFQNLFEKITEKNQLRATLSTQASAHLAEINKPAEITGKTHQKIYKKWFSVDKQSEIQRTMISHKVEEKRLHEDFPKLNFILEEKDKGAHSTLLYDLTQFVKKLEESCNTLESYSRTLTEDRDKIQLEKAREQRQTEAEKEVKHPQSAKEKKQHKEKSKKTTVPPSSSSCSSSTSSSSSEEIPSGGGGGSTATMTRRSRFMPDTEYRPIDRSIVEVVPKKNESKTSIPSIRYAPFPRGAHSLSIFGSDVPSILRCHLLALEKIDKKYSSVNITRTESVKKQFILKIQILSLMKEVCVALRTLRDFHKKEHPLSKFVDSFRHGIKKHGLLIIGAKDMVDSIPIFIATLQPLLGIKSTLTKEQKELPIPFIDTINDKYEKIDEYRFPEEEVFWIIAQQIAALKIVFEEVENDQERHLILRALIAECGEFREKISSSSESKRVHRTSKSAMARFIEKCIPFDNKEGHEIVASDEKSIKQREEKTLALCQEAIEIDITKLSMRRPPDCSPMDKRGSLLSVLAECMRSNNSEFELTPNHPSLQIK